MKFFESGDSMFLSDEDKEIQKILLEAYPEGKVVGLYKNRQLNNRVNRRWIKLNISKREYLTELGFIYSSEDWGEKIDKNNIDSFLREIYPTKIIPKISDIFKKNRKVYTYINEYCTKNCISSFEYLIQRGYIIGNNNAYVEVDGKIVKSDYNISSSFLYNPLAERNKYNIDVICKLRDCYNVKLAYIAKLLGVTRQLIDQQIKRNDVILSFIEEEEYFEDEVIEIVISMIKNYDLVYDKDGIIINFYWEKESGNIAILYKYKGYVKCIFNQKGIVNEMLEQHLYYKLYIDDIILLKKIEECKSKTYHTTWKGENKVKIDDKNIRRLANENKKRYNMTLIEYFKFLGFDVYTSNDEIEDRVYKKMKDNLDADGTVKIAIKNEDGKQNPEYTKIHRDIKRLGKNGIREMAEYFGFKYERYAISNIEEKHRKKLKERYIIVGNSVYIDTQDKFYISLQARSKRVGKTLDEYIEELGFKRIMKDSIPKGHVLYNWRKEYNNDVNNLIEKASIFLGKLADESNEVYLKSDSYEYETMWKYSYVLDLKMNELIEKCGFVRVYQPLNNETIGEVDKSEFNIETIEEIMRNDILVQIEKLESNFKEKTNTSNKINRNIKLPKLLKRLYRYKCQLCNKEESICPSIEMINGEEYVEVHHITQLSEGRAIEDESNSELDSYKNCIVVCCFHHKFLHYHHGGFKKLKLINGKLCFESEKGDVIPIITNYHLSILK